MTALEMQNRFVRALAQRCGEIIDGVRQPGDLQTLARGFRNLAGVAEMYDYYAVTQVSRRCEQLCAAALDEHRTLTEFDRARLVAGIASIRMYGVAQ
ncbi:MAG TPA: hypothetical protein VI391_01080 [Thermoanaerobaculia bacterium]